METPSSEMMSTADLQDLSTQASPDTNPDQVLASGPTVSADDAANAVSKKVQFQYMTERFINTKNQDQKFKALNSFKSVNSIKMG